eukprot:TRINITY_DN93803_c0_g1_i1.p1 TRINITY_DN93803_c0_g1~~TRINITY_DN93803_c0_g1_i1.p1  ORF type:complete len:385 (-),score=65.16 TRINITY_DN93803_c0_g1_i1:130-1284(-)
MILRSSRRCFASKSKSVMRYDEMTGNWVCFAAGRKDRPRQTTPQKPVVRAEQLQPFVPDCPFCPGNEDMTPQPLLTLPTSDNPNYCRVVANKYPVVTPMEPTQTEATNRRIDRVFQDNLLSNNEIAAVGHHEVVIESPLHNAKMSSSPVHHAELLLKAFRDRGRVHNDHSGLEHIMYFKNQGFNAGASLVHPHSQILATPVVPIAAQMLQSYSLKFFERHRANVYAQMLEEELEQYELFLLSRKYEKSRVVDISDHFVALVPFAALAPYSMLIVPFRSCADFTEASDEELRDCANVLRRCLQRMHVALEDPAYNFVLQSAPLPGRSVQRAFDASAFFRWHIRLTPRVGVGAMAGFELGSGIFSNSSFPEEDAEVLREIDISHFD